MTKISLCVALQFVVCFLATADVHGNERPNIIFLLADDQTTSTLGCYGNPIIQTPNIDALATEGTRFTHSFVSHSICWVSRTTLLTGLTGRGYGTPGEHELARPDAVEELVSDLLSKQGYRTGFVGKWHAKMPAGYEPKKHFDVFQPIGRDPYYKPQPDGSLRHETDLIIDRGIQFIEENGSDKPFFLNLWFNAGHAEDGDRRPGIGHFPWPDSVDGMYDEIVLPRPRLDDPAIFDALPPFLRTTINRERYFWRWNTPEKYQTNLRAYYRMISGIDHAIGRLRAALEASGLAKNTIIVYSADNGYYMGNRGLAGKWSHYDESLAVPLIVYDPRLPTEKRTIVQENMVVNVDLPATFLDWAGADVPQRYQGRSIRTLVGDANTVDWRTETFHEHFAVRNRIPAFEGLRGKRFKYVRYVDHGNYEFLHDLENDPDELVNLASSPEHRQTLDEMRQRTDDAVREMGGSLGALKGDFRPSTVPYPVASANVSGQVDEKGFMSMFNGKNLSGWEGDRRYWSVEEGAITGKADGSLSMNRFITWKHSTVRNFEFVAKVRISAGGNSGIQYRGLSRPDIGLDIVSGYQCDVVPGVREYDGMLYEERGRRILAHSGEKVVIDPQGRSWIVGQLPLGDFAADQWHDYRILVRGNHHQHWIDGKMTVDVLDFDQNGRALEGVFAMQVHVGPAMKVQYKNLRIRHLPDDVPLERFEDHLIPLGSLGVKPQGANSTDWVAPEYDGKQ